MNFGDPSAFGTEMADRFVASGANLPPPVSNRVKRENPYSGSLLCYGDSKKWVNFFHTKSTNKATPIFGGFHP